MDIAADISLYNLVVSFVLVVIDQKHQISLIPDVAVFVVLKQDYHTNH